ncbi:RsmB/NOP family class I SAM-dependent RNA methyltransferase [Quadrisphaera sp. GCM10027208]|uniref:RsmB/NOP family class I SAM-dependent RNA methyltransferase n=1 Tax=Quadrisphaera sp. GCM10027208 TaxID=3273423 RepID=UPI003621E1CB
MTGPGHRPARRSVQRPAERARGTDPARRAAYDVLRAVAEDDAYANLVLPATLSRRRVRGRDAAFATELAYGALRGQGLYDAVLARCVDRPLDRLDPPVLDVLRLGAHQLLGMRVPTHAAVSESVALARSAVGAGAGGLVNAVLRRVAEQDLDAWVAQVAPDPATDRVGHLAVAHSHPAWVVRALRESLVVHGRDVAELPDLLAADNARPVVTLAARPGLASVEDLVALGARPGRWSPLAAVLPAGDPGALAPVRRGAARVQDEGSQLAALALLATDVDGPDAAWADLCAGPGGKAALLAAQGARRGATLTAVEVAPHPAVLAEQALAGTPGRHEVRTGDGRDVGADEPGRYDRVLVDAPCTGLGALRRRPEARWRRQPSDLATLGPLQRALLTSALDAVRPGGVVAYVTCTPHPAETVTVLDDVLRGRDDVTLEDTPALVRRAAGRDVPDLGEGSSAQLWPHLHGTDAMFVAVLRRR